MLFTVTEEMHTWAVKPKQGVERFGSHVPVIPSDYERKDHVTKLSCLAARPSLALSSFLFFARPTDPPSREGERWETKHFIGMA